MNLTVGINEKVVGRWQRAKQDHGIANVSCVESITTTTSDDLEAAEQEEYRAYQG
jgi:hypothetical protein